MPTLAQQRLAALADWFTRNSRGGTTPNGGTLVVGRYASIIPWAFDTPPIADAPSQQLIFYVSAEQCGGVALDGYDADDRADSQRDVAERAGHVLFLVEDMRLPPCIIVGLDDPQEPIAVAVQRAGVAGADLDAFPVLAMSLAALADGPRSRLAARLPFVPRPGALDPDMPTDRVFEFENRRERSF